jgi:hypothetical protein
MKIKICARCQVEKQASKFYKKSDGRLESWCKNCMLVASSRRRATRKSRLKKYGLTEESYQELFEKQSGLCAICAQPHPLEIDHNHETDQVRGLLCGRCNKAIGLLLDKPDLAKRAMLYLSERME